MAQSQRWESLHKEVETLRAQFLPDPFDHLGQYPEQDLVQARTRGFMVLGHAELESYFEGWAKDIVRASEDLWRKKGTLSEPLAFLLITIAEGTGAATLVDPVASREKIIAKVFLKYYNQIAENHGVKEVNVGQIFAPLGLFPSTVFGSTLLPNLTAFGVLRGTHAHQSVRAVQSFLDPQTTYNTLTALIEELRPVDDWLVQRLQEIT